MNDSRLYVTEISHGTAPSGTKVGNLIRGEYHLHFVFGGEALYDGTKVGYGNIFIMDPVIPHRLEVISDEPLDQYWIEFGGSEAAVLLDETELGSKSNIVGCRKTEQLRALLYDAVYGDTAQNMLHLKFKGLLIYLLSNLMPSEERRSASLARSELYVRNAMDFLRSGCEHGATVSDAAEYIGLTEKYLCKLFKANAGITPIEFLTKLRMDKALQLLRSTDLSVYEIARSVGFEDQTYFSRFFKRNMGMSPTKFKEEYAAEKCPII